MLSREAIDRLVELGKPEIIDVDGRPYSTRPIHSVIPPTPAALSFVSLEGLMGYLTSDLDNLEKPFAVHVESHERVTAISGHVKPSFRRRTYAEANVPGTTFPFGDWLGHEKFIIALQSQFVATDARASLLSLIGTITADEVRTLKDDGVTQEATAKAGIALSERVVLPNPVTLRPFRTFREIEQPESAFVLRVRKGHNGLEVALFEADGGAWALKAMEDVGLWLQIRMPEGCPVLA